VINPRRAFDPYTPLAGVRLRPLGHLSRVFKKPFAFQALESGHERLGAGARAARYLSQPGKGSTPQKAHRRFGLYRPSEEPKTAQAQSDGHVVGRVSTGVRFGNRAGNPCGGRTASDLATLLGAPAWFAPCGAPWLFALDTPRLSSAM